MDVPSASQIGVIGSLAGTYQNLVNATVSLQTASATLAGTFTFTTPSNGAVQSFNFFPCTVAETNTVLSAIQSVLQGRLSLAQNALSVLPTVTVTSVFGQDPKPVIIGATGATGSVGVTGATGG